MARPTSASASEVAAVGLGGAFGAMIRYAMSKTWHSPHQVLLRTVLTAAAGFLIVGLLLRVNNSRIVRR